MCMYVYIYGEIKSVDVCMYLLNEREEESIVCMCVSEV